MSTPADKQQRSHMSEPLYAHLVEDEPEDTGPGMTQQEVDDLLDAEPEPAATPGEENGRG